MRFERSDGFGIITVDRPEKRNAMTGAMYFAVRYAIDLVASDDSLAGSLLTGTGSVFIPGGDLSASTVDDWGGPGLFGMDNTPFDAIRHSPKPVVSAINGLTQGGGLLMAVFSDVSVAAASATFRAPELFRGIADTGYAQWLPAQIGPARAKDMLFTGRVVTAEEALDWGLINRVVPDEQLHAAARDVLTDCCRCAPHARNIVKRVISGSYGAYDRMSMVESLSPTGEAREGYEAFAERRDPSWVLPVLRKGGRL